jgi:hypothetical protein
LGAVESSVPSLANPRSEAIRSFNRGAAGRPPAADQPQEKPGLAEQPDKAPAGVAELPDEIRKLAAEMVFLTLRLPHLLHTTSSLLAAELVSTSKLALQSLHLYS